MLSNTLSLGKYLPLGLHKAAENRGIAGVIGTEGEYLVSGE